MTERDADQRLRAAFQDDREPASGPVPDDLQEQIWRAVSGDLDPEQRRALVDRTASDPAVAEAWRVASALWQARQEGGGITEGSRASVMPMPTRRPRPWASPWLAAAAALVLITTIVTIQYRRSGPAGDEFRVAPGATVQSLVPDDASLPRDEFRLRWTPGPENARFRVRVTTEDLRILVSAGELMEPELVVSPAALADVPSGARILWQVEMALPAGPTITSSTFIVRVR